MTKIYFSFGIWSLLMCVSSHFSFSYHVFRNATLNWLQNKDMRKTYHLCLSAGNHGLLCRREEDYVRMVNCICIAALRTETIVLAFAVMANHIHLCVRSYDQEKYMKTLRYMYTRYFNSKYHRRGRLVKEVILSWNWRDCIIY